MIINLVSFFFSLGLLAEVQCQDIFRSDGSLQFPWRLQSYGNRSVFRPIVLDELVHAEILYSPTQKAVFESIYWPTYLGRFRMDAQEIKQLSPEELDFVSKVILDHMRLIVTQPKNQFFAHVPDFKNPQWTRQILEQSDPAQLIHATKISLIVINEKPAFKRYILDLLRYRKEPWPSTRHTFFEQQTKQIKRYQPNGLFTHLRKIFDDIHTPVVQLRSNKLMPGHTFVEHYRDLTRLNWTYFISLIQRFSFLRPDLEDAIIGLRKGAPLPELTEKSFSNLREDLLLGVETLLWIGEISVINKKSLLRVMDQMALNPKSMASTELVLRHDFLRQVLLAHKLFDEQLGNQIRLTGRMIQVLDPLSLKGSLSSLSPVQVKDRQLQESLIELGAILQDIQGINVIHPHDGESLATTKKD